MFRLKTYRVKYRYHRNYHIGTKGSLESCRSHALMPVPGYSLETWRRCRFIFRDQYQPIIWYTAHYLYPLCLAGLSGYYVSPSWCGNNIRESTTVFEFPFLICSHCLILRLLPCCCLGFRHYFTTSMLVQLPNYYLGSGHEAYLQFMWQSICQTVLVHVRNRLLGMFETRPSYDISDVIDLLGYYLEPGNYLQFLCQ
jgi:hypothetical protein